MMRTLGLGLAAAVLAFGPAAALLGTATLMHPTDTASCLPGGGLAVGPVPDTLTATTRDGDTITLDRVQLTHAATIITAGASIDGVGRQGVVIALMAALTESSLRMLANTAAYPESADYPHDGDAADHDSLGLFQMRPATGWGTVAELMDPSYQAAAFYGGPTGPNHASPPGLLDIPGWQDMDPGEAAQAVEVSAYPDRYRAYQPVAETILTTLTTSSPVPESGRVVFPLPAGSWTKTSDFGPRVHPVTGVVSFHTGTDYAAPDGTRILATADGRVASTDTTEIYGGLIVIDHTINGQQVATAYAHLWPGDIHVTPGQTVTAGQHIGDVGSAGQSTGPHLHLEIRIGGSNGTPVDPVPWLAGHHATETTDPDADGPGCIPSSTPGPPAPFTGDDPDQLVPDPTSGGRITARTAHILAQVRQAFPDAAWACWSSRPGTASEHPEGRACDGTFGNAIGQPATGRALEFGWSVTTWLQTNANVLGVEYLIWQGRIWSTDRATEGWRPYGGGGMHDPADVTGGHHDHLHITGR